MATFDASKARLDIFGDELKQLGQNDREGIENLCQFIRRNENLIHVDLSYSNLSEIQLWCFGRTLRRAKSIRSVHLTGNRNFKKDSITPRLISYLSERIHTIPEREITSNVLDYNKLPSAINLRGQTPLRNAKAQIEDKNVKKSAISLIDTESYPGKEYNRQKSIYSS